MTGPLAISTGVHAAAFLAVLFLGRFSWPTAPIAIEVVPRTIRARAPSGPPEPKPQPPSAAATHASGKSPKPRPKAPPSAPPTADLKPLAPEAANLVVLLRADRLRRSPHREAVVALLGALPDYHTLIDGTGLSLLDDFQALLIATADPRDVTATFLAARYRDSPRIRAILDRPLSNGDPRVFRILSPGLAVLTRPEDAARLDAAKKEKSDSPERKWLSELEQLDQVGDQPSGPALLVTLADVPALLQFGSGLPTPLALGLAATADGSPELRVKAVFSSEADAARMEAAWPEVLGRYRSLTALIGLSRALDGMKLERHGIEIEIAGRVPENDLRLALSLARALLPKPAIVDDPAPPR